MISEAEEFAIEDESRRKQIESMNSLQTYVGVDGRLKYLHYFFTIVLLDLERSFSIRERRFR